MGKKLGVKRLVRGIAIMSVCLFGISLMVLSPVKGAEDLTGAQQQQLESMQKKLQYEYNVCREHCGGDAACLEKCKSAYDARLANARQRLVNSDAPPSGDIQQVKACPYCGMDRQKFAHSRIYVEYDNGSVLGTCSVHCAAVDMAVNIDKGPLKIWVGDYNTKKLVNAEKAVWVMGGDKMGVMTKRAKWAFGTQEAADEYIKAHGGRIAGFEEVMEASYEDMYQDTKMIRDKRKKKRAMKMGHGK